MTAQNMLDTSNRQGRIGDAFHLAGWIGQTRFMADDIDIESIRAALKRIMSKKNVKPTTLSLQIGTSKTAVKELLEKNGDVKLGTLTRLATALDVDLSVLLERPRIPIAGYIGAGGLVAYEDFGEQFEADHSVPRTPGISGPLIALMVRGTSMFPKYKDGDIIYIQRTHEGWLPEYVGEDCAVRLESGETYIKQLAIGSEPERFTLRSLNAPDMENVAIEWATPVLFIMPARARAMLESRT